MKITGYKLREAIKQHELRRDTAAATFESSLKKFPGEDKEDPREVIKLFLLSERAVAKLQTVQMFFNIAVKVEANGETMTLAEAIKLVGGAGRVEKMWRVAASGKKDRYATHDESRASDTVYATPTITAAEAVRLATAAGRVSGNLRAAIAVANAQEVEIQDLDATLFEV